MIKEKLIEKTFKYPNRPDRRVWVYVPTHDENDRLPVVYMSDGQNLFHEETDPYGGWKVIRAVKNEIKNGSKGAVIVGIESSGIFRSNDLCPKAIGTVKLTDFDFITPLTEQMKKNLIDINENFAQEYTAPEAEEYDRFLLETVMPYVEESFPVSTKREDTAFCGSSMGGLFTYFTTLKNNNRFSFAGVFSPAFLLFNEQEVVDFAMKKIGEDKLPYLYMYTGMGDMLEEIIGVTTNTVYDMLENSGYPFDKLSIITMPENKHNEEPWAEIFTDFLHTFLNP